MGKVHDTWLKKIGIDVDKSRIAAGDKLQAASGSVAAPTFNPTPTFNPSMDDPAQQSAVVDSVVEFGKGFATGAVSTAAGIVNSPGGQLVSGMVNPMGPTTARAIDAAITGDPSKLAPPPLFDFNIDPNDPKEQKKARASVESTKDLGLALVGIGDPLALAKSAPAVADVLVNGDPNEVGQGAGKTVVLVGVAVALGGVGEVGAAEAGATDAGTAEAGAGAAEPPVISPAAESVPAPETFGEAPTQAAPQAPGPISSLDPALDPAPLGDDPTLVGDPPTLRDPGISPGADSVPAPETFGDAPTQAAPQAPGPITSLDPALDPAPLGDAPTLVGDPPTLRDPGVSPAAESVPPPEAAPDTVPNSAAPDTVVDTLRDPPIPNPNLGFPDPVITVKPDPALDAPTAESAPETERTPEPVAGDP